tara:strand:+ start:226 stop:471 length:246 start_codon:yes stop_codon:yes gene_type:complete
VFFKRYFGETAKAALKEICSFDDFLIISLKHFQLFGLYIPGQEVHKPKNNPANIKTKDFIGNKMRGIKKYYNFFIKAQSKR